MTVWRQRRDGDVDSVNSSTTFVCLALCTSPMKFVEIALQLSSPQPGLNPAATKVLVDIEGADKPVDVCSAPSSRFDQTQFCGIACESAGHRSTGRTRTDCPQLVLCCGYQAAMASGLDCRAQHDRPRSLGHYGGENCRLASRAGFLANAGCCRFASTCRCNVASILSCSD